MRKALLLLALAAMPATAQTTNCTTYGSQVNCNTLTTPTFNNSGVDVARQMMDNTARMQRESIEQQNQMFLQQRQQAADAAQASAQRRAAAYAQVGELIAAGKCDQAKALAQFYNKETIVADTARACP